GRAGLRVNSLRSRVFIGISFTLEGFGVGAALSSGSAGGKRKQESKNLSCRRQCWACRRPSLQRLPPLTWGDHIMKAVWNGAVLAAVRAVTLDVPRGQTIVLLGTSGCGKSTLLRLMAGLLSPDAG